MQFSRVKRLIKYRLVKISGGATLKKWREEGYLGDTENVINHFQLDLSRAGLIKCIADLDYENEVIEESEEIIKYRNGDGAILRVFKNRNGGVEHVDYTVRTEKTGKN